MDILLKLGRIAGVGGVLLCIAGVAVRLSGAYWIGGFEVGTLLQAGIAAMVLGVCAFSLSLRTDLESRKPPAVSGSVDRGSAGAVGIVA
ncbi:MAG: hypothetical protein IPI44_23750 [Sulfuritalea sp.]|nr:hypothetical protein [Sulfuritalea sp.]